MPSTCSPVTGHLLRAGSSLVQDHDFLMYHHVALQCGSSECSLFCNWQKHLMLFPQVANLVKNLPGNAGDARDMGPIPELGSSPGEGNGIPFQYSCLGNPMNRGAWQAIAHGVAKELDMTKHTGYNAFLHLLFKKSLSCMSYINILTDTYRQKWNIIFRLLILHPFPWVSMLS